MPFPIRVLQVDGGSEFAAEFDQACQRRRLHLFVLAARSPKLNGAVERANRTRTEEFYSGHGVLANPTGVSQGVPNVYDATVTVTGLRPNTTYHWRPLAKDASGNMAAYHDQTFTTSAC